MVYQEAHTSRAMLYVFAAVSERDSVGWGHRSKHAQERIHPGEDFTMFRSVHVQMAVLFLVSCGQAATEMKQYEPEAQQRVERVAAERKSNIGLKPQEAPLLIAGPISQPYRALGEVQISTADGMNLSRMLTLAASGTIPQARHGWISQMLREEARKRYGGKVDAVINVTYQTRPDGEVFATGLAVHLVERQSPSI